MKADTPTDAERRRYLEIALGQSRKVGRFAQELFELARLEYGAVKPDRPPAGMAGTLAASPLGGRSTWTLGVMR